MKLLGKHFGITVCFLLLIFLFNIFRVVENPYFYAFQRDDSDKLVVSAITCAQSSNPNLFANFLVTMKGFRCDSENAVIYASQYGLQGRIFILISKLFKSSSEALIKMFYLLQALLTAAVVAVYLESLRVNYGRLVYGLNGLLLSFSVWPAIFAKSLYWTTYLMFLPYVFTWIFYSLFARKKMVWMYYWLYGFLLLIKFLSGYEFLSVIALSGIVPIYKYHGQLSKTVLSRLIGLGLVSLAAFAFSLSIHLLTLANYTGSLPEAIKIVSERAKIRGFENPPIYYDRYIEELPDSKWSRLPLEKINGTPGEKWLSYVDVLADYFAIPMLDSRYLAKMGFEAPLLSLLGLLILVPLAYVTAWRLKFTDQAIALHLKMFWLSFLPPLSWIILASGHMFHHLHLNGIIFFIPLALSGYLLLSLIFRKSLLVYFRI